jgi:hypothetical protein
MPGAEIVRGGAMAVALAGEAADAMAVATAALTTEAVDAMAVATAALTAEAVAVATAVSTAVATLRGVIGDVKGGGTAPGAELEVM